MLFVATWLLFATVSELNDSCSTQPWHDSLHEDKLRVGAKVIAWKSCCCCSYLVADHPTSTKHALITSRNALAIGFKLFFTWCLCGFHAIEPPQVGRLKHKSYRVHDFCIQFRVLGSSLALEPFVTWNRRFCSNPIRWFGCLMCKRSWLRLPGLGSQQPESRSLAEIRFF